MILTTGERQLIVLYFCGSPKATAAMIREALPDIFCADTLKFAIDAICKLESMSGEEFALQLEGELCYA